MRFRRIDRYLLLLAALFALAVLVDRDLPGETLLPDAYEALVHRPLLAGAAGAVHGAEVDVVALKSELKAARRGIEELKEQVRATRELGAYFRTLKWDATPQAIGAWVIMVEPDVFRQRFRINRGARDGLKTGMPVVTGHALLGVVAGVEESKAYVQRVDDPVLRLEVEVRSKDRAIPAVAHGADGKLELHLAQTAKGLAPGDDVFTTRYHEYIPPGLLVGTIETVEDLDEDGTLEIQVTPAAALGRWSQVDVLARR